MSNPGIPTSEFLARQKRAAEAARAAGLDGLLVWSTGGSRLDSFGDVFYLTNHYSTESRTYDLPPYWSGFGQTAVLMPSDGTPRLLVHKPDWRTDVVTIEEVVCCSDLYSGVMTAMREKGLTKGRIGLVREEYVPLPLYRALRAEFPLLEFVAAGSVLEDLRMVKSSAEIALMLHASEVGAEIMTCMLEKANPGATDGMLAAEGFGVATALGATPWDFAMASGPQSEHMWWSRLPSFDPRRPYRIGDVIHPDVYGCVDGYFYDLVRSTVVGSRTTPEQRCLFEAAVALVRFTTDQLRAGRRACDVYNTCEAWSRDQGWERPKLSSLERHPTRLPLPFFGHGIGLSFEGPWLTRAHETVLEPGMTVAVEVCMLGFGMGAAHEQDVLITDEEPLVMTSGCAEQWWS